MAKKCYKVPAGLDSSYADMEIALQSSNGLGLKPLPIKVILSYIGSLLLLFYICTHTFISAGSTIQIGLFVVIWIALTVVLASFDKTRRMQMQLVPSLLAYLQPGNRRVPTRTTSNAMGFYRIAGVEAVDGQTGLITFKDGTFGYAYRVVGSASVLLFDDDRDAILDRVDAFYRKISCDCELLFFTTKESQKVYRQIANLKRRYDALDVDSAELRALADEQYHMLQDYVGSMFKSTHQYLIIKGDNKEALISAKNVVQAENENSDLMFKQLLSMYAAGENDVNEIFRTVYRGLDADDR